MEEGFRPLERWLPAWASDLLDSIGRPEVAILLGLGSAALFVLSLLGVPWFLARVPEDYFASAAGKENANLEDSIRDIRRQRRRNFVRLALRGGKNVFGLALLVAGLAMLFVPGPGIITVFVATFFLDFPGKRDLQRRIVARPSVLSAINALRRRRGRPPLVL